uniref:PUM-HD domain-containing protein n=1 Tax=Caenorhabditis tropicalis TaxID=1561998 RepID=A0A1I7TF09_9PELO
MSYSWNSRSTATSSGSSSVGGPGFLAGNNSFDAMSSLSSDFSFFVNKKNSRFHSIKPAVKLLPLVDRRLAFESTAVSLDSDSLFFNSTATDNSSSASSNEDAFQFSGSFQPVQQLPITHSAHSDGAPQTEITLQEVIANRQLIEFALDRYGVKFLETNYPQDPNNVSHKLIFEKFTESSVVFAMLCHNANGNFIAQKLVEFATIAEQIKLLELMVEGGLFDMCRDKFACRVVQLAVQKFDRSVVTQLISVLGTFDFVTICTDQSSIHVVQRIVKNLPVETWSFFISFLCSGDNLMAVCQDKYGCRLVQQAIDRLAENPKLPCFATRIKLLHSLMTCVACNCYRLSSNEFANYVVQYVIKSSGVMEMYRDTIIEKCLLRNLLSMSQDKYASHVIEGAFMFAPPMLLKEMMNEIFNGYVKDSDSNRDALDILLFHQYGNYVVQQMISICTSALMGKEERRLSLSELEMYGAWYEKINIRVQQQSSRLERFSSGKKIIESLKKSSSFGLPLQKPVFPNFLDLTAQFDAMFPSFLNHDFLLKNM